MYKSIHIITVLLILWPPCFCFAQTDRPVSPAFTRNDGQLDESVRFYIEGRDKTVYFSDQGITFALREIKEGAPARRWIVKQDFLDARPNASPAVPEGDVSMETRLSYFKGKRSEWKTRIPSFPRIVYKELWPGIDLVFYGKGNQLKYDLIVKPGADPTRIRFEVSGAERVEVLADKGLRMETPAGTLDDDAPCAFQGSNSTRKEVPVDFRVCEGESSGTHVVSFAVGAYDPAKTLTIDPAMLVYCGFIGGEGIEKTYGVAVDDEGCAYISGYTKSDALSFPVHAGPDLTYNCEEDAFVAKISADGTQFEYLGYIGGDDEDAAFRLAIDDSGHAYVTGITRSDETTFPVKEGPDLTYNGIRDAFVAKVLPDGTDLVYCGYIGGVEDESAYSIIVGSDDCAYVTGWTFSDESSFPVLVGPSLTHAGDSDAFVAKVNPQGTKLVYCGFVGGSEGELGMGIGVDASHRAHIIGNTDSDENTFPVISGPDLTHNGNTDAYVARLSPTGQRLEYCGYIGGVRNENGMDIVIDGSGCAYVTGWTYSDENSFPMITGPELTFDGYSDAYVAKVNAPGTGLIYSGFLGGGEADFGLGIKINATGHAFIGGGTYSDETTFPVKLGPDLTYNGDGWDVGDIFVACVNPVGSAIDYCGYIGGDDNDGCYGIALDEDDNIFVTGWTLSTENTFPATVGPDVTYNGGTQWAGDGLVAKVTPPTLTTDVETISETGGQVHFSLQAGIAKANRKYALLASVSGFDPGYPLPGNIERIPIEWDAFTDVVLSLSNSAAFADFLGALDGSGSATALLDWPGPSLPPGSIGVTMYFAYCLGWPWEFVSNPVAVAVIP